jgi:WD repeat-containing protein 53
LSVDHQVLGYDLRKATSPIITEPAQDLTSILETNDEVNQLSFSSGRSGPLFLAVADDSGHVRVSETLYPSSSQGRRKLLHHNPEHSLVTCTAFHPKLNAELVSGGTDCSLKAWNMSKPHKPAHSLIISRDDQDAQICNPPMVHSVAWSPSGRWIVAGLGDGTLQVTDKSLTPICRLRDGHQGGVASVCFCEFTIGGKVDVNDRIFASAGSDGNLFLWDLERDLAGKSAINPLAISGSTLNLDICSISLQSPPRLLFGIPHGSKVNWIASSRGQDPVFPSTLFVADTTNDITAYTLPLR